MRAAALAAVALLGACDTGIHRSAIGSLDAEPACEAAKAACTTGSEPGCFAYIQTSIFDQSCSHFSACHKQADPDPMSGNAGLSLADGESYANLVGVMAQSKVTNGAWTRVVPGDPDHSYLMVLIDPLSNPGPGGEDPMGVAGPVDRNVGSMPETTDKLLCAEKRAAIRNWIAAGAAQ